MIHYPVFGSRSLEKLLYDREIAGGVERDVACGLGERRDGGVTIWPADADLGGGTWGDDLGGGVLGPVTGAGVDFMGGPEMIARAELDESADGTGVTGRALQ